MFEQETPHFHFTLNPTNFVAGSHYLHVYMYQKGLEKLNDLPLAPDTHGMGTQNQQVL